MIPPCPPRGIEIVTYPIRTTMMMSTTEFPVMVSGAYAGWWRDRCLEAMAFTGHNPRICTYNMICACGLDALRAAIEGAAK